MYKKALFILALIVVSLVAFALIRNNQTYIAYGDFNIKNIDNKWKVLEAVEPQDNSITGRSGSLHLVNLTDNVEISLLLRSKGPTENPQGYERPRVSSNFALKELSFLFGASFTCGVEGSTGSVCYVVEKELTDNGISESYRYWLGEILGFKASTILISEVGKDSPISEQGKAAALEMLEQIISI